jgi:hypothetical protein
VEWSIRTLDVTNLKICYFIIKITKQMTMEPSKSNPLSNNNNQTFKSDLVKTSNGMFTFNLTLKNGSSMIIPMREDGYINATKLCQAGGKEFSNWYQNKNTKDIIEALEADLGIPRSALIEIKKGGNDKINQGSWIHPDLGIQCAQWTSPVFAIKVSRCIRQLFVFGKVELGKEKTNDELEEKFREQITTLQRQLTEEKDEKFKILHKYNSRLQRHRYYKFKKTLPCFYVIVSGMEYKNTWCYQLKDLLFYIKITKQNDN